MKVLIVEDEHRIATSIQKGLIQENYQVDVSFSGTDGLDMASTIDYDVIVLDLMLPGMDGLTVCKTLREQDIHTPILMLTAKSQLSDKLIGFQAGADDYLTKPFAFEELLATKVPPKRPSPAVPSIVKVMIH
jgi:DNA-binding response OmpR family regulator